MKKYTLILITLLALATVADAQSFKFQKGPITLTEIKLPDNWTSKLDKYSEDQLLFIKSNLLLNLAADYKELAAAKDKEVIDLLIKSIAVKEDLIDNITKNHLNK